MDRAGHIQLRLGLFESAFRVAQGHIGRQVEGERNGRILSLMIDRESGPLRLEARNRGQRHHRAGRGLDEDSIQRIRTELILGIDLHHHIVLIERGVHGGDFALSEGVVEHVVNGGGGDAEA